MAFFEALAAASIALGLAIPVFLERVMRPRYEERFEEFRMDSRVGFILAFEKALEKLRRLKRPGEAMTNEVYATMEGLFAQWGQLRSSENRLASMLRRRKPLFVLWMISFLLSLASIQYSQIIVGSNLNLGDATVGAFALVLLYSIVYVLELFDLDDKLSKYKGTISQTSSDTTISRSFAHSYRKIMGNIRRRLRDENIPFEIEPRLSKDRGADLAIPSSKNPIALIEVKSAPLTRATSYPIAYIGRELKQAYPSATTILIVPSPVGETLRTLKENWDNVLSITDIDDLTAIAKRLLHKT
jgi:hypothetical protein